MRRRGIPLPHPELVKHLGALAPSYSFHTETSRSTTNAVNGQDPSQAQDDGSGMPPRRLAASLLTSHGSRLTSRLCAVGIELASGKRWRPGAARARQRGRGTESWQTSGIPPPSSSVLRSAVSLARAMCCSRLPRSGAAVRAGIAARIQGVVDTVKETAGVVGVETLRAGEQTVERLEATGAAVRDRLPGMAGVADLVPGNRGDAMRADPPTRRRRRPAGHAGRPRRDERCHRGGGRSARRAGTR